MIPPASDIQVKFDLLRSCEKALVTISAYIILDLNWIPNDFARLGDRKRIDSMRINTEVTFPSPCQGLGTIVLRSYEMQETGH